MTDATLTRNSLARAFAFPWVFSARQDLAVSLGGMAAGLGILGLHVFLHLNMMLVWFVWVVVLDTPHFFGTYFRTYLDKGRMAHAPAVPSWQPWCVPGWAGDARCFLRAPFGGRRGVQAALEILGLRRQFVGLLPHHPPALRCASALQPQERRDRHRRIEARCGGAVRRAGAGVRRASDHPS
jgi:hypothetical protein